MALLAAAEAALEASRSASASEVLRSAGMTVLIGLTVVFALLVFLTAVFFGFGKLLSWKGRPSKTARTDPLLSAKPDERRAAPRPDSSGSVLITGPDDQEQRVAAIAAAVAMMAPPGKRYVVRRMSRPAGERSAWAAAGVVDNTRSF